MPSTPQAAAPEIVALAAMARLVHAGPIEQRLGELRRRVVTVVLAADLAVAAGAIPEDGTDDALLEAATGIARLVDPGAG